MLNHLRLLPDKFGITRQATRKLFKQFLINILFIDILIIIEYFLIKYN